MTPHPDVIDVIIHEAPSRDFMTFDAPSERSGRGSAQAQNSRSFPKRIRPGQSVVKNYHLLPEPYLLS